MNRNTRVYIFLTAIAISILAVVGLVIYINISFARGLLGFGKAVTTEEKLQLKDKVRMLNRNVADLKAYVLRYKPMEIDFQK
ncbi:hypothetical protein [Flavobacterium sp. AG291]|uniref:hypothetical protein n=1 Tax=Flavobacterium sp. AG291 TaxID=2184000 RepID=UPI000E0B5432|nr:hypothetical protein [Flavobacterium sp. AG291]RDI09748.1 hypothetical protein DEU42_10944 [Flavobacterium sp. AG291]